MEKPDIIEQLVQQASSLFSQSGASAVQQDVENKLRGLVQGAFNRMNVVPRDEFDAQVAVLQRTRAKLDQLEQQVSELSAQLEQARER